MKSNLKQSVIAAIAETQDGKTLNDPGSFSIFINDRIETNTTNGIVNTEDLADDFKYMVDQLQKALTPLHHYNTLIKRAKTLKIG